MQSVVCAASQLPGEGGGLEAMMKMMPLHMHVNQKSNDDDD